MNNPRTRSLSTTGESLYEVMEIPKTATPEDIKRAYRKLALKYHPDKNLNSPESTEKFQAVNHANTVLSNPRKREIYDQYGSFGLYVAHQFGEENISTYFLLNSKLCKGLFVACCILTGCFCCCCCCFCCNFCCGKFKPQPEEEDEWDYDILQEEDNPTIATDGTEPIIASQPGSNASASPYAAVNPASEASALNVPTTSYNTAS